MKSAIKIVDLVKDNSEIIDKIGKNESLLLLEKLTNSTKSFWHRTNLVLEEGASLTFFLLVHSCNQIALDIAVELRGVNSSATLLGVYLGKNSEVFQLSITLLHKASSTNALTWINGVLTDHSTSNFSGLVKIVPGLRVVNSYLANHVLVLGDKAKANTIPSLEIESDDVKCSHEATIGQINEDQLFYLMSRGIDRQTSEKLLTRGFFETVLTKIENTAFREQIIKELDKV